MLALLVVFAHRGTVGFNPVGEVGSLSWILASWFNGSFAVSAFFVVSGFLIFGSYDTSAGIADFVRRRVRRIYPAYAATVLLVSILGALATRLPLEDYVSGGLARYLLANLAFLGFLEPRLPGAFEGLAYQGVANGPLWTLKVEVMFYACVPILFWLARRFGWPVLLAAFYVASILWAAWFRHLHDLSRLYLYDQLARQLPGALAYFLAGGALYLYRAAFARHANALLGIALLGLAVNSVLPGRPLYPACVAVAVIHAATRMPYLGNWARFGDLSYGVYIVHFPLMQTIAQLGWFKGNPAAAFLTGLALTLAIAWLFWHLIEKRWLAGTSHYVQAAMPLPVTPRRRTARVGSRRS